MQPPQGIDMSLIQEALQRRQQGGGGTPPTQQMSQPQGQLPTGGQPMPQQQAPPIPQNVQQNVTPGQQGAPVSPEGAAVAKAKSGMTLDDDGKGIAKALITKLMSVM